MSASTNAAMVANPAASNNASMPNARRRAVVVVEKKSSAHMPADGAVNGVSEDKIIVDGKDLAHTIRGESVLERSKDLSKLKKGSIASTISPRRKKAIPNPEKPKWQTVLSILIKNCLLLAVLLWLGRTVWRWTDGIGKVGSEFHTMARELNKQIEEKGALLEKELKKLEARTDSLDNSLTEFKDMGLISREEFDRLWNELKNFRRLDGSDRDVNLDQIRVFARDLVEKEMEKHAADGLGRVDYALAAGGARVVGHSEPSVSGKANGLFSVAKSRNGVRANAHKMLEPSFGEPGQCFPLQGSSGFVEIRLRTGIIPEAVTLEHVSKVPSALGNLRRPKYVDLRANNFSVGMDGILGQLQSLVHVDLSQNQFSGSVESMADGSSEIITSLQYLNISHNRLSGELFARDPMPLFDSLEVFDASSNQISGHVPSFNLIVSLKILRLGNNQFSGSLPEALIKEHSMVLTELDLSRNQLTGPVPWITSATLKNLNLSTNKLSGSLPIRVGSCAIVDLSNNMFSGNLSIVQNWGNYVEVIDLSSDKLTGTLPNETSQFLRLTSFKVSNNLWMGKLPLVMGTY